MTTRRMLTTAAMATLAVALLSGCGAGPFGAPPSVADDSYRGFPNSADDAGDGSDIPVDDGLITGEPSARWLERAERFSITVFGSSSCPAVPTSIEVAGSDRVMVVFEADGSGPCTADMAATTYEFTVPNEATSLPLTIVLDGDPPRELVLD